MEHLHIFNPIKMFVTGLVHFVGDTVCNYTGYSDMYIYIIVSYIIYHIYCIYLCLYIIFIYYFYIIYIYIILIYIYISICMHTFGVSTVSGFNISVPNSCLL